MVKKRIHTSQLSSSVKPVLTKRDFVRRYDAGEFGNHSPTWNTLDEWKADRRIGRLYHIRNRVAGAETWYDLLGCALPDYWKRAVDKYGASQLYISEMAPTAATLFQGEVRCSERHLDLRYTTVAKPMRDALAEEEHAASGIIATSLLRHYLCPNSMEWMNYLLDAYPDHVIEFSTYAKCWGTLPHYNTVTWEVRKY